jgi:peptidoglycan/LPS O-acetylase OafA/YrhL
MNTARRIDGIDLFRGIAAFAVVILHSDEGIKVAPSGWPFLLNFSAFAVPFFLATSFYLLIDKLSHSSKLIKWTDRFSRLLIPYAFWSAIYLGIKILQFILKKQPDKIKNLLENWPGLIFLGQSGFHLYFIPLLIAGILVVVMTESFIRSRPSLLLSTCLFVLCIFLYYNFTLVNLSDPSFLGWLEKNIYLQSIGLDAKILIFLLKVLGFFLRCSPYIVIALICDRLMIKDKLLNSGLFGFLICLILFVFVNAYSPPGFPKILGELLRGYITLALAFTSSIYIENNSVVSNIGRCSFGIYLMHLLFLQILWSFSNKFGLNFKNPSLVMLVFSVIFTYLTSWLLTHILMRKQEVSKVLFGF